MKKIQTFLLSFILIFSIAIPPKVEAVLGVGDIVFNVNDIYNQAIKIVTDNIQDAATQWMESTAQNGKNAAMDVVKECLDFDFGDLMSNLGGLDLELPCGVVWSIDNPADMIANRVIADFKSLFKEAFLDKILAFINYMLDPRIFYCDFNPDLSFGEGVYHYNNLEERIQERLNRIKDCGDRAELTKSDLEIEKNNLFNDNRRKKALAGTSNRIDPHETNEIYNRGKEIVISINKANEKRDILFKVANFSQYAEFLDYNQGWSDEDNKKIEEQVKKNMEESGKIGDNPELFKTNTDELKKLRQAKIVAAKYLIPTRIPIPIMTYINNEEASKDVTATWNKEWGEAELSPNMGLKWISPFEIAEKFQITSKDPLNNEVENYLLGLKENNVPILPKEYPIEIKGEEIDIIKYIKKGSGVTTPHIKAFETKWREQLTTSLFKLEKTVNMSSSNGMSDYLTTYNFSHTYAMETLIKNTNLIAGEIENFGSVNGNAMLNIIYSKSQLYSQAIIVDILEKQLMFMVESNSPAQGSENFKNRTEAELSTIVQLLSKLTNDQAILGKQEQDKIGY